MEKLPEFDVAMTPDTRLSHDQVIGHRSIFYFYPKDSTPGCTREGRDFAAVHGELQRRGVQIYGVSRDSLKSHLNFQQKQELPFPLLSDPDETLCNAFGVIGEKNMYGRKVRGVIRSTFLFEHDGKLLREWRQVKVPGHVDAVIAALDELPDAAA
ncbi:MAG: peroxiredoxin [Gammaproteobacteria bacterium]|nr:peroxiredoxin [Gammaproteobacteria bacterium]